MSTPPIKLHIGGNVRREGWTVLDVNPGPYVDHVGDCRDLSFLTDASCSEVYASHVLEHLRHSGELQKVLKQIHRILAPNGRLRISVPDLEILCKLFVHPNLQQQARWQVMTMIFGGQTDDHDYHYIGLNFDFLGSLLTDAGFRDIRRVDEFNEFSDTSSFRFGGIAISLNMEARKPDSEH